MEEKQQTHMSFSPRSGFGVVFGLVGGAPPA